MANTEIKIYLTHNQMILTNNQGFRFEFPIPIPGNILIIHAGPEAFRIGQYAATPSFPSPNVSAYDPNDSSSLATPPNEDGNPNQNWMSTAQ